MTSLPVPVLALLIGFFAGLRSLTPVATAAWGAHLGWLKLPRVLAWLGSWPAVAIFSVLAIAEIANDKNPKTPSRTAAPAFGARIVMGAVAGACVSTAGGGTIVLGAILGIVGAVLGTLGGYQARTRLVKALGTPDFVVAVVEDLIAIGGSLFVVSRF